MKAVRLGSYSRRTTEAPPCLRRLKSTRRYRRLAPPPRKRTAIRPLPPRPPDLVRPTTSAFSGLPLWSSLLSTSTSPRRDGEVGLNCFKAIGSQSRGDIDRLALGQGHDRFLVVVALADHAAEALGLAQHVQGVDLGHLDLEQLLDRRGDLVLGGVLRHAEDDLVEL